MRRWAIGFALGVTVLDVAQVVFLPWVPKDVGALAGAALYALLAFGTSRGWRAARLVLVGMPMVPLTVLTVTALGVRLPVAPDLAMGVIFLVQLAAAVCAYRS